MLNTVLMVGAGFVAGIGCYHIYATKFPKTVAQLEAIADKAKAKIDQLKAKSGS